MVIYFLNYLKDNDDYMTEIIKTVMPNNTLYLRRKDGFKANKYMLDAMKKANKNAKVELNVWTDDETMLMFAEYDKNIHSFKVYIRDEHTNDKFIPLGERLPNLRGENNLMKICHIGLLSKIDN